MKKKMKKKERCSFVCILIASISTFNNDKLHFLINLSVHKNAYYFCLKSIVNNLYFYSFNGLKSYELRNCMIEDSLLFLWLALQNISHWGRKQNLLESE